MKKLSYTLVMWDWKDSPETSDVKSALKKGHTNLYELDTQGDFFCWLFSKEPLTKKQLNEITKKEFYDDEEE